MVRVRAVSETVSIVRPLLEVSRAELIAYLREIGQSYREDDSNADLRYTRNRLRHELLPLLRQTYNPAVDAGLRRLGQLAAATQDVVDAQAAQLFEDAITLEPNGMSIDRRLGQVAAPQLVCETIQLAWRVVGWPQQAMGMREWQLLGEMLVRAVPERAMLPGKVDARVQDDQLRLVRISAASVCLVKRRSWLADRGSPPPFSRFRQRADAT